MTIPEAIKLLDPTQVLTKFDEACLLAIDALDEKQNKIKQKDKIKNEISEIIYSSLDYAYCNNCKFDINSDEDICDYCNRKSINWELSESEAQNIASKIIEELKM